MISVTFITTCLVSLVAIIIWRINVLIVTFFFLVFACLDGVYLSSALIKVPNGAWFTLLLAGFLSTVFVLWRYGKEQQWSSEREDRFPITQLLTTTTVPPTSTSPSEVHVQLTATYGAHTITPIHGIGIFFDKIGDMVPTVFTQFTSKFSARPEIIVFFHMRPLSVPSVPESERYVVSRVQGLPGAYRLTIRHGYTDDIVTPDLGRLLVEQLVLFITRDTPLFAIPGIPVATPAVGTTSEKSSAHHSPAIQAELDQVHHAQAAQMVYVMGKEQMRIKKGTNVFRRGTLWVFLWIRDNSRAKMADLNVPIEQCVEVGFLKEI